MRPIERHESLTAKPSPAERMTEANAGMLEQAKAQPKNKAQKE